MEREEPAVEAHKATSNLSMGVSAVDLENGIPRFPIFEGLEGGMKMESPYLELLWSVQSPFVWKNWAR
jgi:hypothetical protein